MHNKLGCGPSATAEFAYFMHLYKNVVESGVYNEIKRKNDYFCVR